MIKKDDIRMGENFFISRSCMGMTLMRASFNELENRFGWKLNPTTSKK